MAVLRSGRRLELDTNGNKEEAEGKAKKEEDQPDSATTQRVVFVGLLIDLLAFTLILPLFPALISHYRSHDSSGLFAWLESRVDWFRLVVGAPAQASHSISLTGFNSVLFGGLLGSLFSFLQFVASPVIGGLSDRYGRKPLLLLSTVGISFSYLLWALSTNFAVFVLARVIGGISKGNVSLSTAIVTDVSSPATRGRGMALIGVAFSLGFLFGPMVGAGFSVWGRSAGGEWHRYPALLALVLSIIDVAFLAIYFRESLPAGRRAGAGLAAQARDLIIPTRLFQFSSLGALPDGRERELQRLGLAYFIYLFLYSGMEFTLTFLTHIRFNFTPMDQGRMFLFVGVLMALLQGGVVRRVPEGGERRAASTALLLIVPSFIIVGSCSSLPQLYIGLALYATSTAFVVPCLTTLVSRYGADHQKGVVTGVFRSLGALGRALGPIFGSFLYWSLGPELSYALGGIGLLVPYVMLNFMT